MDGDRTQQALDRIEAAVARIDAASRCPAPTASTASSGPQLTELQSKHDRLKASVAETLAELDGLIAGSPR